MQDSVSQQIHKAAETLLSSVQGSGIDVADSLNSILNTEILKAPFRAGPVRILEEGRLAQEVAPSIVYIESSSGVAASAVNVEQVACVIHPTRLLDESELRTGYRRIASAKRAKRAPRTHTERWQVDAPLGIIFAIDTAEPIEKMAERMISLNREHPSTEWPDMVVILNRGIINYAVQFEGDPIAGDFLLPNEARLPVMPMYIHLFVRANGTWSFNRMCALLFMQLMIFAPSPSTKFPDMEAVLEGVSRYGMNIAGYQYNLSAQLAPVPDEMLRERAPGLRNLPFRIEDSHGKLLSHIQYIPWQEGGVVRVIGKLPLEIFLVYLGPVMKNSQKLPKRDGEMSSVLPIVQTQFLEMLGKFQRQSNMIVKPEQPSWTVSKMANDGTRTPFMARLFLGITRLRDSVYEGGTSKDEFDKPYEVVLMTILNTRTTAKEIADLLSQHKEKIAAGSAARLLGRAIHVDESIDKELRRNVEDFLGSSVRVLKEGMQKVTVALGIDIGFLFKKKKPFEDGITKLRGTHPRLAAYLLETRTWSEQLVESRNAVFHDGWLLPKMGYRAKQGGIEAIEPEINGTPVSKFVEYMMDRVSCFVEDVTAYGLQRKMVPEFSIIEIPLAQRKPEKPERFQMALTEGGMSLWSIAYQDTKFDGT